MGSNKTLVYSKIEMASCQNRKRTCTRWPALRPCFKLETVDDVVYGIGCFFFGMEAQQHLPVGFHSRGKKEIKEPRSWPSFEGMSLTLDWTCVTSLVGVNWPPALLLFVVFFDLLVPHRGSFTRNPSDSLELFVFFVLENDHHDNDMGFYLRHSGHQTGLYS